MQLNWRKIKMKKMTLQEKMDAKKKQNREKIASMPTIAMCEWHQGDDEDKFRVDYCSQVIKLTKRSVTMRTLEGGGTVTLSVKHNGELDQHVKIIPLPCDTRQWAQLKGYEKKYYDTVEVV